MRSSLQYLLSIFQSYNKENKTDSFFFYACVQTSQSVEKEICFLSITNLLLSFSIYLHITPLGIIH